MKAILYPIAFIILHIACNNKITDCNLTASISAIGDASDLTLIAVPKNGVAPYSYQWSNGSRDSINHIINAVGQFSLTVTDFELCNWIERSESYGIDTLCNGQNVEFDTVLYYARRYGTQCWLVGDSWTKTGIPEITDDAAWANTTEPAWCYYNNNRASRRLYNWHAVKSGKICPPGWHIPSYAEWRTLIDHFGGTTEFCKQLQSIPEWSINFNGRRQNNGSFIYGDQYAHYWTSTDTGQLADKIHAVGLTLTRVDSSTIIQSWHKNYGMSCRCIHD
jgi:uncharacterized protein (TIGR02145 family)